jgi:cysteine desulfurase
MRKPVYLDYNATAPVRSVAAEAVARALQVTGNASSVHAFGRAARRLIEDARAAVAGLVGGPAGSVVFTSGGTEANNLALRGFANRRVVVSAGEHDSVLQSAPGAARLPLRADGQVDLEALEGLLSGRTGPVLVSVMAANNETGVVQPVAEAARLVHQAGGVFHCDAVQAAGKIPFSMHDSGIDLLSLSAHKIGGPQGVGALVVGPGPGVEPQALLLGGGQERARRAGTENLPGIAGFSAAADLACRELDRYAELARLRGEIERRLLAEIPTLRIYGADAPRLPNTACFGLAGLRAETQVMALDLDGVAVSAGSACSSGKVTPSHVLRAMGASEEEAGSAIRVSLGWDSRADDIERFLDAWLAFYRRNLAA